MFKKCTLIIFWNYHILYQRLNIKPSEWFCDHVNMVTIYLDILNNTIELLSSQCVLSEVVIKVGTVFLQKLDSIFFHCSFSSDKKKTNFLIQPLKINIFLHCPFSFNRSSRQAVPHKIIWAMNILYLIIYLKSMSIIIIKFNAIFIAKLEIFIFQKNPKTVFVRCKNGI